MKSIRRLSLILLFTSLCIHQSISAALEGLDQASCKKINFKETGFNCTEEDGQKQNVFPILGNCTAYFKCVFIPSLGSTLPENDLICEVGQVFDYKRGACAPSDSKDGTCDQIRCANILEEVDVEKAGNASSAQKSGQYNYGPTTKAPTNEHDGHDPHEHAGTGRANQDDNHGPAEPLPPNHQDQGRTGLDETDKKKEAKSEHGEHNLAQELKISEFLSLMLMVTCAGLVF